MSKVTVIIPCYNAEGFIEETLKSVSAQLHKDLEVICIDDGSSDATLSILKSWAELHPEVTVFYQENQGANATRNRGLALATGEYLQYLDADDYIAPEKIAEQIELAARIGHPDIIVGAYFKVNEAGEKIYDRSYEEEIDSPWLRLMRTDLGITSANLFKREKLLEVNGWDVELKSSQEYDLMFRMMQAGAKLSGSSSLHTKVLQRASGSITSTKKGENWKRYIELRRRIRDHVMEQGLEVDAQAMGQILFDAVRMLYPYDAAEAKRLHRDLLSDAFVPQESDLSSPFYIRLYKLFGFSVAERLRALLR